MGSLQKHGSELDPGDPKYIFDEEVRRIEDDEGPAYADWLRTLGEQVLAIIEGTGGAG